VPTLAGVAFLRHFAGSSTFAVSTLSAAAGACSVKGANAPATSAERQSEAEYDLARDAFYKEQPRQALDYVRKAIDLDSDNANALYFASTIHLYFCSGRLELSDPDCRLNDAETYARKALEVNEHFREAKNTLGQIYILERKYPEAIRVLEPLTKDPAFESSFLAWGNLGWAQVLAGHLDQGIESLKSSITEPRFCVGHYRLGIAYEKKGDLAAAEASLTNAVSVDAPQCKNLQDAWEERARVRMQLGKLADARADFEKCRDIAADSRAGKACVEALARIQ
jgi:type IV pilus assembly protein PilF